MQFKRIGVSLLVIALAISSRAQGQVPYDARDVFAAGPTTLLHTSICGEAKELWAGLSRDSSLRSPLFVEFSGRGEVLQNGKWLDLTTLRYRSAGTRPGTIRLQSEEGLVSIEAASRKEAPLCPIFVKYSFKEPVTFRYRIAWKSPETARLLRTDDAAGFNEFSILWRHCADKPADKGLNLVLATSPAGTTELQSDNGVARVLRDVQEITVCLDATGERVEAGDSYVAAWQERLAQRPDRSADSRVRLTTDNPKLDALFSDSIDAVRSAQFANGTVLADVFFYRDSWVRDGAYAILGLSLTCDDGAVERFFDFWTPQPGFPWAGGEHEAQQAGIAMAALWYCAQLRANGDAFLRKHWPFVQRFAAYYRQRVAAEGMLDLSEEWICCVPTKSTWPNAEVYCGLRAAARIADRLGYPQEARACLDSAQVLREKLLAIGYDEKYGRFIPMAGPKGEIHKDAQFPDTFAFNGPKRDERTDSGMLMLARLEIFGPGFGAVAVDDPRFVATQAAILKELQGKDLLIARFAPWHDTPHYPKGEANRWPIVQCWAAQVDWLQGNSDAAWQRMFALLGRKGYDTTYWNNYLPESWAPDETRNDPFLTWSHGEFLTTVIRLTLGLDVAPTDADLGLAPGLPPGTNRATLQNFRFRNWRMDFELTRGPAGVIRVKVQPTRSGDGAPLRVALPGGKQILFESGKEALFEIPAHRRIQSE